MINTFLGLLKPPSRFPSLLPSSLTRSGPLSHSKKAFCPLHFTKLEVKCHSNVTIIDRISACARFCSSCHQLPLPSLKCCTDSVKRKKGAHIFPTRLRAPIENGCDAANLSFLYLGLPSSAQQRIPGIGEV